MKQFKFFTAALILCISLMMSVMISAEASDVFRVGVFDIGVLDEDIMPNPSSSAYSYSEYNTYQKFRDRYEKIFFDALAKTENFDAVRIKSEEVTATMTKANTEYYKAQQSKSSSKNSDYRPIYNRSMTDRPAGLYDMSEAASKAMQNYAVSQLTLAKQKNCRYLLNSSVHFDTSSKQGIRATVHLLLSDVNKMELTPNIHASGESQAFSTRLRTVDEGKKPKRKAQTSSKSKKKGLDSPEQSLKEKLALEAFTAAIQNLQDILSGNAAKIVKIEGNNIFINKGSSSNAKIDNAYIVKTEVHDGVDDIFGEDKDASIINIAIIKIKDVQEDISIAEIVPDGGNINAIHVDDTLEPMLASRIDDYLLSISDGKRPPFPVRHPEAVKAELKASEKTAKSPSQSRFKKEKKKEKTVSAAESLPALPPGVMRVGVINFDSQADGISATEASTLTDLFSRMLSNSDKIAVLERDRLEAIANEHELNLSGVIDSDTAAQIGKLASCQYILLGSVTGIEERDTISGRYIRPTEKADFSRFMIRNTSAKGAGVLLGLAILSDIVEAGNVKKDNVVTATHEVITNVDARLVNVQTSQIAASFTGHGSAAQSDIVTQDGNGNIKDIDSSYGDIENQSIASAAANLGSMIREFLTGEKLQISSINNGEIIINRGSSSGIQTGDLFCVYSEGQSYGDTEAIISVKEVQDSFSTAELVKSINDSYTVTPGSRLEFVLHSDFQKGIWHIKNQKRAQSSEKAIKNISLEDLANNSGNKKRRLENSSTDAKKVIKSYGLSASKEKMLINAHSKASKANNSKKKYEAYKQLSEADNNDYLAAYNTGRYALEQSMYIEAREWVSKALFVNPNYVPAKKLIEKIDNGD